MIDIQNAFMDIIDSVMTLTDFKIADSHSLIISSAFSVILSIVILRLDKN